MTTRLARLLIPTALLLGACTGPLTALLPGGSGIQPPLVTPGAQPSGTPSPFGPLQPTETLAITLTPSLTPSPTFDPERPWGTFPGPTDPSAIEIPPPAPLIEFGPNVVNVVLLGSDQRPYTGGYRTDVVMLLSLDPDKGTATLLSFPRDLYVYIPGWKVNRINTAEPHGGFDAIALTILYNFGIPVHHWARMNFSGFISAVNTLGGIDVEVGRYMTDKCGDTVYSFSPGIRRMDGWTAHCYVRMRYATSDFDRLRRQQEVVEAIFRKIISLQGLSKVPELYTQFGGMVQTSVQLEDTFPLIPLAAKISVDPSMVRRFTIDSSMTTSYRVPISGAAVQLPNWDPIREMLNTAFGE